MVQWLELTWNLGEFASTPRSGTEFLCDLEQVTLAQCIGGETEAGSRHDTSYFKDAHASQTVR